MQYLKMLKLLYFADRECVREKGFPVTGDDAFAMDYGPVLTRVYDYIKCSPRKGAHVWAQYFQTDGYDLVKIADPGTPDLSKFDKRILTTVYEAHKEVDGFDLSQLSHDFPEWKAVYKDGTSTPISLDNLLDGLGISAEDERQEIARAREADREYFDGVESLNGWMYSDMIEFAGSVKGTPSDGSRNHDQYLYGPPAG